MFVPEKSLAILKDVCIVRKWANRQIVFWMAHPILLGKFQTRCLFVSAAPMFQIHANDGRTCQYNMTASHNVAVRACPRSRVHVKQKSASADFRSCVSF